MRATPSTSCATSTTPRGSRRSAARTSSWRSAAATPPAATTRRNRERAEDLGRVVARLALLGEDDPALHRGARLKERRRRQNRRARPYHERRHGVIDSFRCTGGALRSRRRLSDSTNTEKPIAK